MRDGPRRFTQDFSCPALLRCRLADRGAFRVPGFHRLRPRFPAGSATLPSQLPWRSFNPGRRLDAAGLGSCAFARHYSRNHFCFLFLRVLRCFSSPGSPPASGRMTRLRASGCPIRTSAGRWAFAPRRGFSQLVTSFFASGSLGILHVPFSPFLVSSPLRSFKLWSFMSVFGTSLRLPDRSS